MIVFYAPSVDWKDSKVMVIIEGVNKLYGQHRRISYTLEKYIFHMIGYSRMCLTLPKIKRYIQVTSDFFYHLYCRDSLFTTPVLFSLKETIWETVPITMGLLTWCTLYRYISNLFIGCFKTAATRKWLNECYRVNMNNI